MIGKVAKISITASWFFACIVNQLMEERVILNYALDMERSHLWVTMQAKDQEAIMDILATFPIIKDVKVEIFELAFFDSAPMGLPELIMN